MPTPPTPSPLRLPRQPSFWVRAWWFWFALLFCFSSIPGHHLGPLPFNWFDKLQHAGFFLLGSLLQGAWLVTSHRWPRRWWLLPATAAATGLFDEAHQLLTPGRYGLDPGDWLADVLGGLLALAAMPLVNRLLKPPAGSGPPVAAPT